MPADALQMEPIARYHCDFPEKFGLPRQSGLLPLPGRIVFEKPWRDGEALRGLEGFDRIWLLWGFSGAKRTGVFDTVRPPRLGGNRRMGVFATRAPNRPNPIGLSCVALERVEYDTREGAVLHTLGGDLKDGTPIYDIKPYLPFADAWPDAKAGFAAEAEDRRVEVVCEQEMLSCLPEEKRGLLLQALSCDPRPAYHDDPQRVYGMAYADWNIRFRVADGILTVTEITEKQE